MSQGNLTHEPRAQSMATVETESQRAIQEVQASMTIAQRFPRDTIRAKDRIIEACTRPRLAEGALYSYNKGGSAVSGPSIRLAEVAAQCWGNMQFGIRELEQRNGESTVETFAWDLESNCRQVKVFQVPHVRYTRKGSYALEDPREIYEHIANQAARRLRACILGVIPGDVIEDAVAQCEATMKADADTSPEAVKKMTDAFKTQFGVTTQQIEKRLGNRIDAIRPAQIVKLRTIFVSMKDGMSVPDDWFEAKTSTSLDEIAGEQTPPPNGQPTETAGMFGPGA